MMQCIAFATADQYHLPTLCHDLTSHGFHEIDLPRGTVENHYFRCVHMWFTGIRRAENCLHFFFFFPDASNALVISTDMTAKPEDDALMFFFRWPFIFSQMQIPLSYWLQCSSCTPFWLDFEFFFDLYFREGSVVFWNVEDKMVSKLFNVKRLHCSRITPLQSSLLDYFYSWKEWWEYWSVTRSSPMKWL